MASRATDLQSPEMPPWNPVTESIKDDSHAADATSAYTNGMKHNDFTRLRSNGRDHPPKTLTGVRSEHGHSLTRVQPMSKHSGSSVVTFFNGLFQTILAISTLGASITFSYVLSNNAQLPQPSAQFGTADIQMFLSISWLLFLLALAFAALGSTLLTFFKAHWIKDWEGLNGKTSQFSVQIYAVTASAIMGSTIVGAFVLLSLVVVAYSPVVGWIAAGFTGFFGFIIILAIINQVPWPWRNNTPDEDICRRDGA